MDVAGDPKRCSNAQIQFMQDAGKAYEALRHVKSLSWNTPTGADDRPVIDKLSFMEGSILLLIF